MEGVVGATARKRVACYRSMAIGRLALITVINLVTMSTEPAIIPSWADTPWSRNEPEKIPLLSEQHDLNVSHFSSLIISWRVILSLPVPRRRFRVVRTYLLLVVAANHASKATRKHTHARMTQVQISTPRSTEDREYCVSLLINDDMVIALLSGLFDA